MVKKTPADVSEYKRLVIQTLKKKTIFYYL